MLAAWRSSPEIISKSTWSSSSNDHYRSETDRQDSEQCWLLPRALVQASHKRMDDLAVGDQVLAEIALACACSGRWLAQDCGWDALDQGGDYILAEQVKVGDVLVATVESISKMARWVESTLVVRDSYAGPLRWACRSVSSTRCLSVHTAWLTAAKLIGIVEGRSRADAAARATVEAPPCSVYMGVLLLLGTVRDLIWVRSCGG